jgi:hypothetical protein
LLPFVAGTVMCDQLRADFDLAQRLLLTGSTIFKSERRLFPVFTGIEVIRFRERSKWPSPLASVDERDGTAN